MMKDNSMMDDTMMNDEWAEGEMMDDELAEDSMMETTHEGNVLAGTTTKYIEFNNNDYQKALEENKIIVLNFYASWCPVCKAEQPEVFEAFEGMDYSNVIGFRVNYKDSDVDEYEEQLARDFGISYQHTKVILVDGEKVLKAPDSWSRERYIEEISRLQ